MSYFRKIFPFIAPILYAGICWFPATVTAQDDRWYDIELLIFKYTRPEPFASEYWPDEWSLQNLENSVKLDNLNRKHQNDFRIAPEESKSFAGLIEKIEKSSRYQLLSYTAWQQRGLEPEKAVAVQIQAGTKYIPVTASNFEPTSATGNIFTKDIFGQPVIRKYAETQSSTGPVIYELEGTIKIVLSRFLHVYTDLLFMKPVSVIPTDNDSLKNSMPERDTATPGYRIEWTDRLGDDQTLYGINIKAHRRMRSRELHHIDHPLLGILIQAKPVETEAAKP